MLREIMKKDSRLSVALHVLVHLDDDGEYDGAATSEQLGEAMGLHPVVLRRTLAGLREAGIVRAQKGHGGGWALARRLDDVTLADVYRALGSPPAFSLAVRDPEPRCIIEREVNRAVEEALDEAHAHLLERFAKVSLADLAEVRRKAMKGRRHHAPGHRAHTRSKEDHRA